MIRTQILLTEEQFQTLKALAAEKNVSISELIRRSVEQLVISSRGIPLSERRKRAIAIAGRFHSGDPDAGVSEEHDVYLSDVYSS